MRLRNITQPSNLEKIKNLYWKINQCKFFCSYNSIKAKAITQHKIKNNDTPNSPPNIYILSTKNGKMQFFIATLVIKKWQKVKQYVTKIVM